MGYDMHTVIKPEGEAGLMSDTRANKWSDMWPVEDDHRAALGALTSGAENRAEVSAALGTDDDPRDLLTRLVLAGLAYMKVVDREWRYFPSTKGRQLVKRMAEVN